MVSLVLRETICCACLMHAHVCARVCMHVCVHVCVRVRPGMRNSSHHPVLRPRPAGAGVPVRVAVSYLRRNYPLCVCFI